MAADFVYCGNGIAGLVIDETGRSDAGRLDKRSFCRGFDFVHIL